MTCFNASFQKEKMSQAETTVPEYKLKYAVWETTVACNMHCRHCGSGANGRSSQDLSTEAALGLCDSLVALGLRHITMSGGEPLLRNDWDLIANHLTSQGVSVHLITNGWLVDSGIINRAVKAGISNFAVSLDGEENTHDTIRCAGAFTRVMRTLDMVQAAGLRSTVATTVTQWNLHQLPALLKLLEDKKVDYWQFQIGVPMGNLTEWPHAVIDVSQIEPILDFAFRVMKESSVKPCLADCLGYYTTSSVGLLKEIAGSGYNWRGCQAGKSSIGILHDGSINGCTAIRDSAFVEGNVRETPLSEIWNRPGAFAWNRQRKREDLSGFCRKCRYGGICLGGCTSLKLATTGTLSENHYCAYRFVIERLFPKIDQIKDYRTLLCRAKRALKLELYEIAERCLSRALVIDPSCMEALALLDFISLKLGKAIESLNHHEQLLALKKSSAKALRDIHPAVDQTKVEKNNGQVFS